MFVLFIDVKTEYEESINEEIQDPLQCSAISGDYKADVLIKTECIFLKEQHGNFEVSSGGDSTAGISGIL